MGEVVGVNSRPLSKHPVQALPQRSVGPARPRHVMERLGQGIHVPVVYRGKEPYAQRKRSVRRLTPGYVLSQPRQVPPCASALGNLRTERSAGVLASNTAELRPSLFSQTLPSVSHYPGWSRSPEMPSAMPLCPCPAAAPGHALSGSPHLFQPPVCQFIIFKSLLQVAPISTYRNADERDAARRLVFRFRSESGSHVHSRRLHPLWRLLGTAQHLNKDFCLYRLHFTWGK